MCPGVETCTVVAVGRGAEALEALAGRTAVGGGPVQVQAEVVAHVRRLVGVEGGRSPLAGDREVEAPSPRVSAVATPRVGVGSHRPSCLLMFT